MEWSSRHQQRITERNLLPPFIITIIPRKRIDFLYIFLWHKEWFVCCEQKHHNVIYRILNNTRRFAFSRTLFCWFVKLKWITTRQTRRARRMWRRRIGILPNVAEKVKCRFLRRLLSKSRNFIGHFISCLRHSYTSCQLRWVVGTYVWSSQDGCLRILWATLKDESCLPFPKSPLHSPRNSSEGFW